MSRLRRLGVFVLAASVAVLGPLAMSSTAQATQAAWTTNTEVSASVTSGSWEDPLAENTCTATDMRGRTVDCRVTGIDYTEWGRPGDQTRNYYLRVFAPGAKNVSFRVDLRSASGWGGSDTEFAWDGAGVSRAAQWRPADGWSCSQLPLVEGTSLDWHTGTIYFPVYEDAARKPVMCP